MRKKRAACGKDPDAARDVSFEKAVQNNYRMTKFDLKEKNQHLQNTKVNSSNDFSWICPFRSGQY